MKDWKLYSTAIDLWFGEREFKKKKEKSDGGESKWREREKIF